MTTRQRVLLLGLAVLFVTLPFVPAALILLDQPGLSYPNVPFPVINQHVYPGDPLVLRVERCNRFAQPLSYTFTRNLVPLDAAGAVDPGEPPSVIIPGASFAPPGCAVFISRLTELPPTLPPGYYKLEAVTLVQGQWRTFSVPWETEPFVVEARP
jgi:hypothetical protein